MDYNANAIDTSSFASSLPTTVDDLAAHIETALRTTTGFESDLEQLSSAEITRLCRAVAKHGSRIAVFSGLDEIEKLTEISERRAQHRMQRRVQREMRNSKRRDSSGGSDTDVRGPVISSILATLIAHCIKWFLRWLFADELHQSAVSAIGSKLQPWGEEAEDSDNSMEED